VILPYPVRLLCLCLATFFLVHLLLALGVALIAPGAIRMARRMRARWAARMMLGLRLFPLAGAGFVIAGVCVPSFLWFESEAGVEEVGTFCIAIAMMAAVSWACSTVRSLRAMIRSARYVEECIGRGHETHLTGVTDPVWVVEDTPGCLLLAGIVRPRVLVSRTVIDALSARQLAAALRHERVHHDSHDNLKRLLLLLAPDVFPFVRGFEALDREWGKFTEWAADDGAVAGDRRRSIALATALVRVARLNPGRPATPLAACLVDEDSDLSARVERLLGTAAPRDEARAATLLTSGLLMSGVSAGVVAILQPGTLQTAHRVFEQLIH